MLGQTKLKLSAAIVDLMPALAIENGRAFPQQWLD
jgi:hypothetical protein